MPLCGYAASLLSIMTAIGRRSLRAFHSASVIHAPSMSPANRTGVGAAVGLDPGTSVGEGVAMAWAGADEDLPIPKATNAADSPTIGSRARNQR